MQDDRQEEPHRGEARSGRKAGRRPSRSRRSSREKPHRGPSVAPEEGPEEWKGFHLSPFQRQAIAAIRQGHNVLVSAPTGAGKTLVAEYAIEDAVRRKKRCIYTAPIKALSNQKFRDFRDDPEIDVGLLTGDVTIRPHAQVLIMTTEILRNAIFDNPEYLNDVEFAIFDEVHFLDDLERGCVWEESLIFAPPSIRVLCLSATIPNLDEIGEWLSEIREHDMMVVSSEDRPVPLTQSLYTPEAGVFSPRARERAKRLAGKKKIKKRNLRGRRPGRFEDERPPHLGPLIDSLIERDALPALVFAFSRRDCERLAGANVRRQLLDEREAVEMEALQRELLEAFDLPDELYDGELLTMARSGIAYHHAGMLPVHKDLIERLFTTGKIKLLFTTETFAVGINMPARSVVFHSLRKFDGVSFDYLRRRDYLQMAGRAGRQGIDAEGLIFCSLSAKDLREAPLDRILRGKSEPIRSRFRLSYSTVLHLVSVLGRERLVEAWEKSLNQFQHSRRSRSARERNSRTQRALLEAHLGLLDELGYLEGDELTPRGRFASHINGYELQMTEHLFRGSLENLSPEQLAVVFVAHIHEERRRFEGAPRRSKGYSGVRTNIMATVRELNFIVAEFEIPKGLKIPDFGLTPVVVAWMRGASMDDLEASFDGSLGDLCRTLRMSLQLMRQVKRAIDPDWDLFEKLTEASERLNRDEVDARQQLQLG